MYILLFICKHKIWLFNNYSEGQLIIETFCEIFFTLDDIFYYIWKIIQNYWKYSLTLLLVIKAHAQKFH